MDIIYLLFDNFIQRINIFNISILLLSVKTIEKYKRQYLVTESNYLLDLLNRNEPEFYVPCDNDNYEYSFKYNKFFALQLLTEKFLIFTFGHFILTNIGIENDDLFLHEKTSVVNLSPNFFCHKILSN